MQYGQSAQQESTGSATQRTVTVQRAVLSRCQSSAGCAHHPVQTTVHHHSTTGLSDGWGCQHNLCLATASELL